MISGKLIPFAGLADVGRYGKGAKPLDDEGIVSAAERERSFRAAGIGGALKQQTRSGEIPVVKQILPTFDQSDDFFVVERNLGPIEGSRSASFGRSARL